ncbi:hypothetical protein GGH12_000636 [Coemansia sp. RSA 1822]|nr:hypothetical protein LPJ76_001344 [Coemansia sp. RSA 638]KAJ2566860.1 hypothetical protein GGH12_000636 [Coemansia sp. RSA 1822]
MDEKSVAQPAKATRPRLRTIFITLFATCVLYTSFMLAYGIDQFAVLASALTQSHVECTYVQAPMVILQSTTVQLTWTTTCTLTTRVTYTNGTHEQHTRGAVTRTGPLDTWFEYTAEIPVEYQQCIEYKVGGLDADRGLPEVTGRYCHKLAQEMQPHVGFAMGVGDLDMIAQDRDLEWARGIHHILASSDPDIIIDTSRNPHTPRVLLHVARAPTFNPHLVSGYLGSTCTVFSTSLTLPHSACATSQSTILVLSLSTLHMLEYHIGSRGYWQTRTYKEFSRAIDQMNVKAVIVKTRFMYAIDVNTGMGIERSVPVCGLVAQHLRVCAPISGAVLSSVGSGLRVEAYGIGANMFGSHVTDVDDAAARLPIAERAEL